MSEPLRSVTGRLWQVPEYDVKAAAALAQEHGIDPVLAAVMAQRGIPLTQATHFLNPTLKHYLPEPNILLDMEKGVDRLCGALTKAERIVVYSDYDVDGATSSAMLRRYFAMIGVDSGLYIPDRIGEGYGANSAALLLLKEQGTDLVLMTDCGTTADAPLTAAYDAGLDIIVLDHHASTQKLPPAAAVINPNRFDQNLDGREDLRNLCAAGVCFIFLTALQRRLRSLGFFNADRPEPALMELTGLAAVGTVCDVMPLTGINRAFTSQGLKIMNKVPSEGIKALKEVTGVNDSLAAYHLGYIIGPRLNAGGRVGQADMGSLLLSCDDAMQSREFAALLHEANALRRAIESQILEDSITQVEHRGLDKQPVIIVYGDGWHPGVIGIVAGRLKERYHRPACVVAFDNNGVGKGSGRSLSGIHLGHLMHEAVDKGLLHVGGGHEMAAGFTVHKDKFVEFCTFITETAEPMMAQYVPKLTVNAHISLERLSTGFVRMLSALEPYGQGHREPHFAVGPVFCEHVRPVGENHLQCTLANERGERLKAIAFRSVDTPLGDFLSRKGRKLMRVAGHVQINTWMGRDQVNMIIEDAMEYDGCGEPQ